jgi:hypothetical protein
MGRDRQQQHRTPLEGTVSPSIVTSWAWQGIQPRDRVRERHRQRRCWHGRRLGTSAVQTCCLGSVCKRKSFAVPPLRVCKPAADRNFRSRRPASTQTSWQMCHTRGTAEASVMRGCRAVASFLRSLEVVMDRQGVYEFIGTLSNSASGWAFSPTLFSSP